MPRYKIENNIRIFRVYQYVYWSASITIMRKLYRKSFPYNDDGYKQAELWLQKIRLEHG